MQAWQAEAASRLVQELFAEFPLKRPVAVQWRNYRTTAGMADFRDNAILLGHRVLDTPDKLAATLRHEYAHLLAFDRYGLRGRGHGPAWIQAMRDLGQAPEVYHRYECKRNQPRRVVIYVCAKCGTELPRLRRLPQRRRYLHASCGGTIRFKEIRAVTPSAE